MEWWNSIKLIQDYLILLTCSLGLPTLSNTQLGTQIIFSFIPTVIATLLEPFWVLVGRYLALYQPYIELRRGIGSPASSLGLKYTNIPPVLIAPRALRHGHIFLFLASMMVITANLLAVALGGIFDRSFQPLTTYPFTTSINTEIQKVISIGGIQVGTFAKDTEEHWLVVNTNVVDGTDLPAWVTDEFYFLPFELGLGNKTGLRTAMTQGYGGRLACKVLAGNDFYQISKMDEGVGHAPMFGVNVTMPISDGAPVRCENNKTMDVELLKPGTHPFAVEWVWGLEASDGSDQKAVEACGSRILAGWGRGEAYIVDEGLTRKTSATMQSNTTIICHPQIATGKFRLTVDEQGRVKRSRLISELIYNNASIFSHSTSIANFTAQLAMLLRAPPKRVIDFGIMHNDNQTHSFSQFIGGYMINKTLSDPSAPSPSFEDAQQAMSNIYRLFFTILLAQNRNTIFVPAGNVSKFESFPPRMFMDPMMFYIVVGILGFQLIAGTIIFASIPRRFLPRFPYNLVSEISFFHASSALSDVAGTANMNSALRSRHLKRLGGTYGYGRFKGPDGESHVGIERMSLIRGYKEAVVTTSASSTIPERTTMVRTVGAVMSASPSPPAEGVVSVEGAISAAGNVVVPVLAVDQIGAQRVSAVEVGTSVCTVTGLVSGSAVTVAVTAGEDDLELVVYM